MTILFQLFPLSLLIGLFIGTIVDDYDEVKREFKECWEEFKEEVVNEFNNLCKEWEEFKDLHKD